VDAGLRVGCADEAGQRQAAGVDGHGRWVSRAVDDEAVVDVGLLGAESEELVGLDTREGCWAAGRDRAVIYGEVLSRAELDFCALDGGAAGEIKVSGEEHVSRRLVCEGERWCSCLVRAACDTYEWFVMFTTVSSAPETSSTS